MVPTNPVLENNRQNNSRPSSSQINRKSPTTLVSNEKVIDGDAVSSISFVGIRSCSPDLILMIEMLVVD